MAHPVPVHAARSTQAESGSGCVLQQKNHGSNAASAGLACTHPDLRGIAEQHDIDSRRPHSLKAISDRSPFASGYEAYLLRSFLPCLW